MRRIIYIPTGVIEYSGMASDLESSRVGHVESRGHIERCIRQGKIHEDLRVWHGSPLDSKAQISERKGNAVAQVFLYVDDGKVSTVELEPLHKPENGNPLYQALYNFLRHPADEGTQFQSFVARRIYNHRMEEPSSFRLTEGYARIFFESVSLMIEGTR